MCLSRAIQGCRRARLCWHVRGGARYRDVMHLRQQARSAQDASAVSSRRSGPVSAAVRWKPSTPAAIESPIAGRLPASPGAFTHCIEGAVSCRHHPTNSPCTISSHVGVRRRWLRRVRGSGGSIDSASSLCLCISGAYITVGRKTVMEGGAPPKSFAANEAIDTAAMP